jgi:hypothetical protein
MKKTTVDLTLSILLFVGYFFTGLLALPFIAGILFGDYLIAKYNWMGLRIEEDEIEESWASQFEIMGNAIKESDQNKND